MMTFDIRCLHVAGTDRVAIVETFGSVPEQRLTGIVDHRADPRPNRLKVDDPPLLFRKESTELLMIIGIDTGTNLL
jgi:hypothetical protein